MAVRSPTGALELSLASTTSTVSLHDTRLTAPMEGVNTTLVISVILEPKLLPSMFNLTGTDDLASKKCRDVMVGPLIKATCVFAVAIPCTATVANKAPAFSLFVPATLRVKRVAVTGKVLMLAVWRDLITAVTAALPAIVFPVCVTLWRAGVIKFPFGVIK